MAAFSVSGLGHLSLAAADVTSPADARLPWLRQQQQRFIITYNNNNNPIYNLLGTGEVRGDKTVSRVPSASKKVKSSQSK